MTHTSAHRWQSLNTQLKTGAAFALLALLLFSLVGFLSGQLARRQVAEDTGNSLAQVATRLSASLDADMFERYREIQNLADLDTVLGADSAAARWRPVLEKLQQTYPYYAWIGISDAEGSVLAATGGVLEGRSVAQRPWFKEGRIKPFAGDVHDAVMLSKILPPLPYYAINGEPLRLVDIAAPVLRNGQVVAVLGAHLSWRWADERRRFELQPIEAERQLEVLVVNGRGEPLLDVASAPGIGLPADELDRLVRDGPAIKTWSNGKDYLSALVRSSGYRQYPGLGWQVLVRQPVETAMLSARTLERRIWAFGLVGAALFGVLGWWLAGRLSAPLRQLALEAEALQTQPGELPSQTERTERPERPERSGLADEVGQLAATLAALMRRLQRRSIELAQLNQSLEQRVKQRTQALEHANEHLQSFSQSVSHDLKGPIGTIGVALRHVVKQEGDGMQEASRRTLRIVADECDRLRMLVDELLTLAQVEQQPLQWTSVSMAELARAAVDHALADANTEARAAEALELIVGELPTAQGDPILLLQVWQNLISNALKFSRKAMAPRIEIRGEVTGDELLYSVCDNGSGFDMKHSGKLFGVFQRLHHQSDFPGTGIGLTIVKRIVQRHGGRVWAHSVPGERTSFYFALPVQQAPTDHLGRAQPAG